MISMKNKKAIVVHSGGMDSSICLALAVAENGKENVLSLSFEYSQRHQNEITQAKKIANYFDVENVVLDLSLLGSITDNALVNASQLIEHKKNLTPNTLVVGRNGLMARLAAIYGYKFGVKELFIGVMELEVANSGYRDCSREYFDLIQTALQIDLNNEHFKIKTPLVNLTKYESMELAHKMGVLSFLLEETITCYEGVIKFGCGKCPSCLLRNEGIREFLKKHPTFDFSYKKEIVSAHNS
jgi:7-cyano-7-deazaguanine synthase